MWDGVLKLISEIQKCEAAGAETAALSMSFICIDTMTYLGLEQGKTRQSAADFVAWVDQYLKGHMNQSYQYSGIDVYGARCAVLHTFSAEADFHQKYPDAMKFGYHDGGMHIYDPTKDPKLVLIGLASFVNDVLIATLAFVEACKTDADLRTRAESRLPQILANFPITQK